MFHLGFTYSSRVLTKFNRLRKVALTEIRGETVRLTVVRVGSVECY